MADNEGRTVFDENDAAWVAWQMSPWGAMRYRVVAETLHRAVAALGGGPLRVLDVGGGDGADSVPLAAHGHAVTVVDPSSSLLARARGRAESAAVGDRLATVVGGIDDLQALDLGTFDLVLCHNVLQYQPDLERSVAALVPSVSSTGLLSVMCPNPASDVLTAAIRLENPVRALAVLDAETVEAVTFSVDVRRVQSADVARLVAVHGLDVMTSYGVLTVTTYIANDVRKYEPDFFRELETLELALCDREPYVRVARMWQLIAGPGRTLT